MTDPDVSPSSQALIVRPRVLPTTAQFAIEQALAWKLRNARGFLPNHFMVGDENERAAKILAAIEYARAVGIEPMIALQNTQIIEGKVGASALLIGALLRKAGYTITDDTNEERSIVTVAKNGAAAKGEFSMQDAQRAQLLKPNSGWTKYPRDMMYARALTQAARRGAQDAVLGMAYTAEELGGVEEEIAGVPVIEGQAIEVAEPAAPAEVSPGVSTPGADERSTAEAEPLPATAGAETPPPPPTSMTPLSGAAVTRRMGRSIGPAPKRQNVVTVEQEQARVNAIDEASRTAVTPPEEPAQPVTAAEPAASQDGPAGLTDEPVPAAESPVVDEGELLYRATLREELRKAAATLTRTNRIYSNKLVHAPKNEASEEITPAEPNAASDEALRLYIERDFPGRTLETLGTAELQNRLEGVEASLAKKRATMKERGVTEE